MKSRLNNRNMTVTGKYNLCKAALIGAIIGILSFSPIWINNNGQYMDYGDYFLQYIPFIKELKRMVLSGDFSWSWNSFLGAGFVESYSYYTVFNIFAWIAILFPDKYILYGTMFITILKFSISMVSSMLYMKRFCKKESYALIGALLYTFSGFTLVNTSFYFFLDVICLFPFLMYGLELLIVEDKSGIYVWFVALNAITNYYFFISTVFIVIIYIIFRLELYKFPYKKETRKKLKNLIIYSVIGTGLASICLIPSCYAIFGSGKARENIGKNIEYFFYPQKFLEHVRTLVAPIESGRYHVFFDSSVWSSTALYLPVLGCTCVIQWCCEKKDWLKKISVFLLICYFVPILNAMFNLFSSTFYTRWLYGMVLVFALISALTFEEFQTKERIFNKKILLIETVLTAVLLLIPSAIYVLYYFDISFVNRFASVCTTEYFMGYKILIIMLILTSINYYGVWYIANLRKNLVNIVVIIIMLGCTLNYTIYNVINYDKHATEFSNEYYYEKSLKEGENEKQKKQIEYRIDHPEQIANYSLFKNLPSVNYYNSIQNPNSSYFAEAVGIGTDLQDTILTTPYCGGEYTDALLSVKYYYDYDGNSKIPESFSYLKTDNDVKIYENNNYIPMGFTYDTYCFEEDLDNLTAEERAKQMLKSLVVKKENREEVNKYLQYDLSMDDEENLSAVINQRKKSSSDSFKGDSKGFTAIIDLQDDNIIFFSVPNDNGWEIMVNGKKAETLSVNYGLLGICCNKGKNIIEARYHTKGLVAGIMGSTIFALILLFLNIKEKNKSKCKIIQDEGNL